MGKQRTPHGQRAGRRMPLRPGPANSPAAEMPTEAMPAAEPQPSQDAAETGSAPAEVVALEATPVATEASSETVTETAETAETPTAEADAVTDAEVVAIAAEPEGPAAGDGPAGELPEEIVSEEPTEVTASDEERAEAPTPDLVLSDSLLPVAAFAAPDASGSSEAGGRRPAAARTTVRFAFASARIDVEGIGVVLANYMHNESVAVLSYMRALGAARSPADMIRLNVTEMQRAADASLTCWSDIARRTARGVPWQREKAAA